MIVYLYLLKKLPCNDNYKTNYLFSMKDQWCLQHQYTFVISLLDHIKTLPFKTQLLWFAHLLTYHDSNLYPINVAWYKKEWKNVNVCLTNIEYSSWNHDMTKHSTSISSSYFHSFSNISIILVLERKKG